MESGCGDAVTAIKRPHSPCPYSFQDRGSGPSYTARKFRGRRFLRIEVPEYIDMGKIKKRGRRIQVEIEVQCLVDLARVQTVV